MLENSNILKLLPKLINKIPDILALLIVIISLAGSLYKSVEEKNPSYFFEDFGTRFLAADKKIYDNVVSLNESGLSTWNKVSLCMNILSSLVVMKFFIKIIYKLLRIVLGWSSPIVIYFIAILILGLIESTTIALIVENATWNDVMPYSGLFALLKYIISLVPFAKDFINNRTILQ